MVVPPFLGQEFLLHADHLTDEKGYVPVRGTYQTEKHDDVYAVGVAAAANIAAQVRGETPTHTKAFGDIKAICVMDAGNNGVIILADKMLPPR